MELISRGLAQLGESALWDAERQCLHWLDMLSSELFSLTPDSRVLTHQLDVAPPLAAIVQTDTSPGAALLAGHSIYDLDLVTGATTARWHPIQDATNTRFNDATVSPSGELWAGTAHTEEEKAVGSLWRIFGPSAKAADSGFVVANGPAFSPDGGCLYLSDSFRHRVLRYPAGSSRGTPLFTFSDEMGLPDGLAVDQHGDLWVALWSGGAVARISPEGFLKELLPVPAPLVTSVAFGGTDLRTVFVTTARTGLNAEELDAFPLSGSIFATSAPVPGVTIPAWKQR